MEAKQRTRKRKQPPSNPLTGIFTRQKSQIFFHNNRSGKSRPDPVRKTTSFLPKSLTNISSQMGKYHKPSYSKDGGEGEDEDEEIYDISIKDLRARRIFSKPLVQKENSQSKQLGSPSEVESGKNLNPKLHSELNDGNSDRRGDESCGFERSGEERRSDDGLLAERYDLGTNLRSAGCFDGENPNLSMARKCDSKDDVESEDLNTASPTSSIQGEDYTNENPDSSMVEKLSNTAVDFMGEGTNGENPSLPMAGKCDSIDFENPNSSLVGRGDTGVEFKEEDSNGENPNSLIASIGTADGTGEIFGCFNSEDTLDAVKEEKFDVGLDGTRRTSGHLSPDLSKRDFKGLYREICEGFTEENVQTTPPDAVIQIQQNGDGSALQNPDASSRSLPKKISPTKGKKNLSDSKRNMVLKPCPRMKVFKAPNSFSYRRLLPYLLDMAKDTSSELKATPCPKIEADVGEKPIVSSSQERIFDTTKLDEKPLTISPCLSSQEVSGSRKDEEKVSLEPNAIDLKTVLAAVETPVNCSQNKSQVNWVSPESQIANSMENDSQGGVSPGEQTAVDSINTLQDVSLIVKPDQVDSSLASTGSPEALEKDANSEVPFQLSVYAEGECRTAHVEFKTGDSSISVFHSSAKPEAVVPSDVPAASLAKGILKRNPRGCRGICNCLNCASFRLNAGKAFEFSRNQMLDAEELVFNMMKELSNLRIMLEKSVNNVKNHAILPVDQVQDACKRASNMEDIARNRLSQMSEDLYVHCRTKSLERPRVNFSTNVEEKFIEKSSKQIDQNNASKSLAL